MKRNITSVFHDDKHEFMGLPLRDKPFKGYKVPDSWYTSENIRLSCIRSTERWFKTKHGSWIRLSNGTTDHYISAQGDTIVLTEHFKQRLYERSGLGLGSVKAALDATPMSKLKMYDNNNVLFHFGKKKFGYTIIMEKDSNERVWRAKTMLINKYGENDG